MLKIILTLIMLGILSYTDFTTQKIPNKITFPFFVIGLMMSGFPNMIGIALIVILFLMGTYYILPMGDVKMFMALCFMVGGIVSLYTLALSQFLLIAFHFAKKGKAGIYEIKTKSYPLAPFVMVSYIVIIGLRFGGVL